MSGIPPAPKPPAHHSEEVLKKTAWTQPAHKKHGQLLHLKVMIHQPEHKQRAVQFHPIPGMETKSQQGKTKLSEREVAKKDTPSAPGGAAPPAWYIFAMIGEQVPSRSFSLCSSSSTSASWLWSSHSMVSFTAFSIVSLSAGSNLEATCKHYRRGKPAAYYSYPVMERQSTSKPQKPCSAGSNT